MDKSLENILDEMNKKMKSEDLSDEYLRNNNFSTREEIGIGEYAYGITMIPCEWVYKYLSKYKQLEQENENLKQAAIINDRLYQKVCNKNKELEERVKVFDKAVKCDKCDCNICEAEKLLLDSIPKSLIKEKIEELEKQIDDLVQNGDIRR